jgi:hypothetical protein
MNKADLNEEIAKTTDQARALVNHMLRHLEEAINAVRLEDRSKPGFKVAIIRETLFYRTEELAESALMLLERGNVTAAIFLVRGVLENTALQHKLLKVIKSRKKVHAAEVDTALERLLNGYRQDKKLNVPKPFKDQSGAYHILTLIEDLGSEVATQYANLSEFVHPNASGVAYSFSEYDHAESTAILGKRKEGLKPIHSMANLVLILTLDTYLGEYAQITDHMVEWMGEPGVA